jgi:DNA modification methylase
MSGRCGSGSRCRAFNAIETLPGLAENIGFHIQPWIFWYETFGVNCTRKFNRCSRPLLWLVKNRKRFVFNADAPEIRRLSDRQTKYNDARANPKGKLLDDVWQISRVCGTFNERIAGFPTQLPLELLRRVVACASCPGDLVVDPFSGSATTGAVCIEMGRHYRGIELSVEFAEMSRTRLRNIAVTDPRGPTPESLVGRPPRPISTFVDQSGVPGCP